MSNKRLVSVVDDDESVREAVSGLMKSLGFAVETFASAQSFLGSTQANETGCLIADVQMPGMTGLELHCHLRDSGSVIPTILITAYPQAVTRARAHKEGVVAYLTKPFRVDELLLCLETAFGHDDDKKDGRS